MNARFHAIPGYAEASARQRSLRDAAFIAPPLTLCGFACEPLTVRRYALLSACGNPFAVGGSIGPEHVAQFLWCLSPEFAPDNVAARDALTAKAAGLDYAAAVDELRSYCETVFLDAPGESGGDAQEPAASWMAGLIDTFGSEYGWPAEVTLELPMPVVFQLLRSIQRRHDPQGIFFNRLTDAAKSAYLAALNAPKT